MMIRPIGARRPARYHSLCAQSTSHSGNFQSIRVMQLSDLALMERIVQRDADAFEAFYARHAPSVMGLLVRILGKSPETEDVLQETFWQAWRKADQFDAQRAIPLAWLFSMARSRAIDQIRRTRKTPAAMPMIAGAQSKTDQVAPDQANACMCKNEPAANTRSILAELPDEQREAITLAFYGGLSHSEIAEMNSLPLGTVKTRIRRGIQRMRETMDASHAN